MLRSALNQRESNPEVPMKRQSRMGDVIKEEKKKKAGLRHTLNLLWSQKVKDCFQFSTLSYEKRQGVTCLLLLTFAAGKRMSSCMTLSTAVCLGSQLTSGQGFMITDR